MTSEGVRVLLIRAAYAVALIAALGYAFLILRAAAVTGTLGYDFMAYDLAVDHLLGGESMYNQTATSMGALGLFFYPPPFALLVLPFALLPEGLGVLVWTSTLVAATVAAIILMPVSGRVRLVVGLLAAVSWPLVYAIKLGQVGPVLLLLFAIAWRALARPWPFGVAAGLGTIIKIQPALLVLWALATGRRRAAFVAISVVAVLALAGTVIAGPQSWFDMLAVLGRVSRPVLAENDMGFGRLALLAGATVDVATLVHYANVVLVLLVTAYVVLRLPGEASFLVVVTASQFVSPVLWDHYALILLLPVAWLLERGRWWAALIPLVTATILVGASPPIAYPISFWVVLLAVMLEGVRSSRARADFVAAAPG
jgi:hypothetical protein